MGIFRKKHILWEVLVLKDFDQPFISGLAVPAGERPPGSRGRRAYVIVLLLSQRRLARRASRSRSVRRREAGFVQIQRTGVKVLLPVCLGNKQNQVLIIVRKAASACAVRKGGVACPGTVVML